MIRQSQELARSNADLEQFAYTISHDLQEPLRNIAMHSQLLSRDYEGRLNQCADEIIHVITSSVERMNTLIHDLLAYSRVGNVDAAPMNSVDLSRVVEWACGNLRAKIVESDAIVEAEPLPTVRSDQVQMVQVFQNLIDNAIKYGGSAQPTVRISAERTGGDWKITVRDNGIGIDPRHHTQIFAVFKRLHGRDIPVPESDWRLSSGWWSGMGAGFGWNRMSGRGPHSISRSPAPLLSDPVAQRMKKSPAMHTNATMFTLSNDCAPARDAG